MTRYTRVALWLTVSLALIPTAWGQEPPAKPKPKVELRWLESKHVKGLTEDWGIKTSCGPQRSYPHKEPVLTNKDITKASFTKCDFSSNGLPSELYMVSFQLTEQGRKTLAEAFRDDKEVRELIVFVDGKDWGIRYLKKSNIATFVPQAGFMSSKSQAERIVEAFK